MSHADPSRRASELSRSRLDAAIAGGDVAQVVPLAWRVHGPSLRAFFLQRGFSGEESDELLQEVFALMVENWPQFDGRSLGGWLVTFARYEALRVRRSSRRRLERQARYLARFEASYEMSDPVQLTETSRAIFVVVRSESPENRLIFWMSVEQGLSPTEIAAQLHPPRSPQAVRNRLHRIRSQIRDALRNSNHE